MSPKARSSGSSFSPAKFFATKARMARGKPCGSVTAPASRLPVPVRAMTVIRRGSDGAGTVTGVTMRREGTFHAFSKVNAPRCAVISKA